MFARNRIFWLFFLIHFHLFPLILHAQTQKIKFDCFTLEDGLSQTTVLSIVQDKRGFMWFGTVDGLNKFDGYNFTVYAYNSTERTSISDDWVTSIYADDNGVLWIGTLQGGLNKFNPKENKFTNYEIDVRLNNSPLFKNALRKLPAILTFFNSKSIKSIYEDKKGILWIGTFGSGLFKFDKKEDKLIPFLLGDSNSYNYAHNVMSMCETVDEGDSILWIGTFGGGLIKYTENNGFIFYKHNKTNPNSLSSNYIMCIYPDTSCNHNFLWVGTLGGGLNRLDISNEKFQHFMHEPQNNNSISDNNVLSILKDKFENIWIGTLGAGLDQLNLEKMQFTSYKYDPTNPYSLGSDEVLSLYEDRSGIIWIGTNLGHGINKFNKQENKFTHFYHNPSNPNSINDNAVFSIFEDRNGALWIGTFKGGLNKFDRKRNKFTQYSHDPKDPTSISDNFIRCIYEDSHGELWIGTFNSGLDKFDRIIKKFIHYPHDPFDSTSISATQIRSIYEDQSGNLWIGTFGGGLDRFDREREVFFHYQHDPSNPKSLSDDRIYAIIEGDDGVLWIATFDGGINRFDRSTGEFISYKNNPLNKNSLSDNRVFSIYKDPNDSNIIWVGTSGGGLDKFDIKTETFKHYTQKDGLPNDVIYGVLTDNDGNLWLSTNKGISKFNLKTETFTNYDVTDGLQSNEFNAGAYYKSKNGEMFFGGINGFNCFYPEDITVNSNIPPIVITSFKVFDREMSPIIGPISEIKEVELSYKENFISFEFSALDYTNLRKNQFAYKLEGFNEEWIKCSTRRYVNYTNLNPGKYIFKVKGSNSDGIWNEEGASVKLTIIPPFWRTLWFSILAIGITFLVTILFYKYRMKVNIKRSLEMERIRTSENERVRKSLAADFHDELGQKLTRISLFSEILKRKSTSMSHDNIDYIDKIRNMAKELTSSTRDFIRALDPSQDSLYDIIIYLKDFGDETFDKTGINFRVNGISKELETVKIPLEWRRHLILIFKEAMNNVLKHAECKNVSLNLKLNQQLLEIMLSDDGVGYEFDKISMGQGLNNMRHRAELIRGTIEFIANNGIGTQIKFKGKIPQMGY